MKDNSEVVEVMRKRSILVKFLPVIIVVMTIALAVILVSLKGKPKKVKVEATAFPVNTMEVMLGEADITVTGYGTVVPDRELDLKFEVSGKVVEVNKKFTTGGIITSGSVISSLDNRDYKLSLDSALADLDSARAQRDLELGSVNVAKKELALLGSKRKLSKRSESLALREPQLKEKNARVKQFQSRYNTAKLSLERTTLTAPFDLLVIDENIDVGSYVTPQLKVGRIAAIDRYKVDVSLPISEIRFLTNYNGAGIGVRGILAEATIYDQSLGDRDFWEKNHWHGLATRLAGSLEDGSRMSRLTVTIDDPLNIGTDNKIPLQIGSYVKVDIKAKKIKNVFKIPSFALRANNKIWMVDKDGTLKSISVNVVRITGSEAIINGELPSKLELVTSMISVPIDGMKLKPNLVEPLKNGKAPTL